MLSRARYPLAAAARAARALSTSSSAPATCASCDGATETVPLQEQQQQHHHHHAAADLHWCDHCETLQVTPTTTTAATTTTTTTAAAPTPTAASTPNDPNPHLPRAAAHALAAEMKLVSQSPKRRGPEDRPAPFSGFGGGSVMARIVAAPPRRAHANEKPTASAGPISPCARRAGGRPPGAGAAACGRRGLRRRRAAPRLAGK